MDVVAVTVALALLQAPVPKKNPTVIGFTCPDHNQDTGHEVDIIEDGTGRLVQTLVVGDPPANESGEVEITLSVQPIAFGNYHFVVRATVPTLKSADSLPSELWQRVPGSPGKPVVK